ncbi:MAG: DUF6328 family protein [Fimbriimonas sp.]
MASQREELSLEKQMSNIQEEARMILPGIQALFGFQLIAVFQEKFSKLPEFEKHIHLAATTLTLTGILLLIAPAAYHRITEPHSVTDKLVKRSTLLITIGLFPLAVALSLDFYLFTRIVLESAQVAAIFGGIAFVALVITWFIWPKSQVQRSGS